MKIYTKAGDKGTTSLFGGTRVEKNSARIKAYGEVDELNSLIGVILADFEGIGYLLGIKPLRGGLLRIQSELFVLGADLATPLDAKVKVTRIRKSLITKLEKEIDNWSTSLPQLKNFILPGGSKIGSKLHLTRSVARRAERAVVDLSKQEKINKNALIYLNRLSDWFFVLARYVNKLKKVPEKVWSGRSR